MSADLHTKVHHWLYDLALPFWAKTGIDPKGLGAWEALSHDGEPLVDRDKRIRVHPRQAYVFAKAAAHGEVQYLDVAQGLFDYTMRHGMDEKSSFLVAVTKPDGSTAGRPHELYDLAFVLLACAALTEAGRPQTDALMRATQALEVLDTETGWANNLARRLPRAQNPYMHMFEATTELYVATGDEAWKAKAAMILELFKTRFLRADGAVLEFFAEDWTPLTENQQVEPGHILEWIWLLDQYAHATDTEIDVDIAGMFRKASDAMTDLGLFTDTQEPVSDTCRLWPQCEALKASIVLERRGMGLPARVSSDQLVAQMFESYFNTPVTGGWFDKLDTSGAVISTDMPSSSFYHIYVALKAYLDHRA